MFSTLDTLDSGEPIELDISNYAEIGHKHEITDVNNLEERLEAIESQLKTIQTTLDLLITK